MSATTTERRWLVPAESSRRSGLAIVGLCLFAFFSLSYDNFFSADNGTAIALNMSSIAIAAIGGTALLLSGNVDLSIGSQFALVSVVVALVARDTQSAVVAVVVGIGLGALLGLANGVLVRSLKISPLIVTLGTLAVYRGLAYLFADGVSVFGFPRSFVSLATTRVAGVPTPTIVAALVFLVGSVVILRTVPGLRLYAIGGDEEAARRTGIAVTRTVVSVFAINGALIGLVAVLTTARLQSGTPAIGIQFEMDVLTAVILGGVAFQGGSGHPIGVLTGVIAIGVLNAGLIFAGLQDWWQQIAKGSLLLLALSSDQLLSWWRGRRALRQKVAGLRNDHAGVVDLPPRPGRPGDAAPVLAVRDLSVRFGGVTALDGVSLDFRAGEVTCLLGDNGAGKSTLIKVVSGAVAATEGSLVMGGPVRFSSPRDARRHGIETVFQDLAVCPNLGVAHNLVLGDEPRRHAWWARWLRDDVAAAQQARERLGSLGVEITDLGRPVSGLSGGQRQSVAISRVMHDDVRLVILDEPTAALGVTQTSQVLRLVTRIADLGHPVVLITHDVEQVKQVADRVVVLRQGRIVHDGPAAALDTYDLIHLMAGLVPKGGDR